MSSPAEIASCRMRGKFRTLVWTDHVATVKAGATSSVSTSPVTAALRMGLLSTAMAETALRPSLSGPVCYKGGIQHQRLWCCAADLVCSECCLTAMAIKVAPAITYEAVTISRQERKAVEGEHGVASVTTSAQRTSTYPPWSN